MCAPISCLAPAGSNGSKQLEKSSQDITRLNQDLINLVLDHQKILGHVSVGTHVTALGALL